MGWFYPREMVRGRANSTIGSFYVRQRHQRTGAAEWRVGTSTFQVMTSIPPDRTVRAIAYYTLSNAAWDRRAGLHDLDYGLELDLEGETWGLIWGQRTGALEVFGSCPAGGGTRSRSDRRDFTLALERCRRVPPRGGRCRGRLCASRRSPAPRTDLDRGWQLRRRPRPDPGARGQRPRHPRCRPRSLLRAGLKTATPRGDIGVAKRAAMTPEPRRPRAFSTIPCRGCEKHPSDSARGAVPSAR